MQTNLSLCLGYVFLDTCYCGLFLLVSQLNCSYLMLLLLHANNIMRFLLFNGQCKLLAKVLFDF